MCSESLVRHLLTSWIHKYLESGLLGPLGPGSKIGPKCSEIGRCQPRLRGMNPPRWDPPPAHRPPWALSCTLCISVISAQGAFQTCASCIKKKKKKVTYVILPAWLAQKVGSPFFFYDIVWAFISPRLFVFWVTETPGFSFILWMDWGALSRSGSPAGFLTKCIISSPPTDLRFQAP